MAGEKRWEPASLIREQKRLARKVKARGDQSKIRFVAGLDAAYSADDQVVFAAAVLFDLLRFEPCEEASLAATTPIPYVPGFLSFREAPALAAAVQKLGTRPHALLCDGQGIAHPRGLGLASHLGVLLGLPSAGCAKSRLVGEYEEPGPEKGSMSPLRFQGKTVGMVVRTRTGKKPLFVSPGHLLGVMPAARLCLRAAGRFRIPEPLRLAHQLAAKAKRDGR